MSVCSSHVGSHFATFPGIFYSHLLFFFNASSPFPSFLPNYICSSPLPSLNSCSLLSVWTAPSLCITLSSSSSVHPISPLSFLHSFSFNQSLLLFSTTSIPLSPHLTLSPATLLMTTKWISHPPFSPAPWQMHISTKSDTNAINIH